MPWQLFLLEDSHSYSYYVEQPVGQQNKPGVRRQMNVLVNTADNGEG